MKRGLFLIAIDQALLSGSSFLIAATFVAFGQKTSYSWYTLATSSLLLFSSIQNATISTPLLTIGPRLSGSKRERLVGLLWVYQFAGSLGLGLLGGAGLLWWSGRLGAPLLVLSICLGVAVTGAWAREMRRAIALLDGNAEGVLVGDAVMVAISLSGFAGGWALVGEPRAEHALISSGLAGLLTSIGRPAVGPPSDSRVDDRDLVREVLTQTRWTLPSVVLSWLQSNLYPFVVSGLLSVVAVADLAATRLTMMPAMLISAAWARYRLPVLGSVFAGGNPGDPRREALKLARLLVPVALLNCLVLALALWSGLARHLPAHYQTAGGILYWWGIYAVISAFRTSLSTCVQAKTDFRMLFGVGIVAALVAIGGVAILVPRLGVSGAPLSLSVSELVLCTALWVHLSASRPTGSMASTDDTRTLEGEGSSR